MTHSVLQHQISDLLHEEVIFSQQLLDILLEENAIFSGNDPAAIEKIVTYKADEITKLEKLTQQRSQLIQQAGFSDDKSGMKQFIDQCDVMHREILMRHWQQLNTTAEKCRRQNEINGNIINIRFQNTQQAINLIHGKTGGDLHYGPNGETSVETYSSPIAKA